MNSEQKQILIYAATFTLVVAAVVTGNFIFYKWIAKKESKSETVIE